jgi:hypothetical protein
MPAAQEISSPTLVKPVRPALAWPEIVRRSARVQGALLLCGDRQAHGLGIDAARPTTRVDPVRHVTVTAHSEARDHSNQLPVFLDRSEHDLLVGSHTSIVRVESSSIGGVLARECGHARCLHVTLTREEPIKVAVTQQAKGDCQGRETLLATNDRLSCR